MNSAALIPGASHINSCFVAVLLALIQFKDFVVNSNGVLNVEAIGERSVRPQRNLIASSSELAST